MKNAGALREYFSKLLTELQLKWEPSRSYSIFVALFKFRLYIYEGAGNGIDS